MSGQPESRPALRVLSEFPGLFFEEAPEPALGAGKPLACLCLAAIEPSGVAREDLVGLLWPNAPAGRARAAMRQALHVLRRALGPGVLDEKDARLSVVPGRLSVDLFELLDALSSTRLAIAHSLWQVGPFGRFSLADAPPFNHWADGLRSRLGTLLGQALLDAANADASTGNPEQAVGWLTKALDVSPFDEETHASLVRSLLVSRRLDEGEIALRRMLACVDDPTPGLVEALLDRLAQLRRGTLPAPDGEPSYPSLQFAGRTSEVARLRVLWRSVLTHRSRVVAVVGEAGIGKTRLAEEFVRYSVGTETQVLRLKANEAERSIELGFVADLARELVKRPGGAGISSASHSVLRQLVPSLGSVGPYEPPGPATDAGVADALLDLIEAIAQEGPLVLLIDDLQWVDARSRPVVIRVLRTLRRLPVLTIMTCRSGDADLSALRLLLGEEQAGRVALIRLRSLGLTECHEALSLALTVEPENEVQRVVDRLFKATRGNPLFLTELVRRLSDEAIVFSSPEGWHLAANRLPSDLPLPNTVQEILEARIRSLASGSRWALAVLADSARGMSPHELTRSFTGTDEEQQRAVTELVEQGLAVWRDGNRLALAHDSLRVAVRRLVPSPSTTNQWWRRPGATLAGAVLLAVVVAPIWVIASRTTGPGWGTGVLLATMGNEVVEVSVPREGLADWDIVALATGKRDITATSTRTSGAGHLTVFGMGAGDNSQTTAFMTTADGVPRPILRSDGDVVVFGPSPDGEEVLLGVAEEAKAAWHLDLVRFNIDSGVLTPLYEPSAKVAAAWLPDRSAILVSPRSDPDTLILLRPDGLELWRRAIPGTQGGDRGLAVCNAERAVLLRVPLGKIPEFLRANLASGEVESLAPAAPVVGRSLACSPDAKTVAFVALVEGKRRLVLQNVISGDTLVGPEGVNDVLNWVVELHPSPVGVRAEAPQRALHWGETTKLSAAVVLSDSSLVKDSLVTWQSLDPRVAYVTREGLLFAAGGGTARLVARVMGWITDTVDIEVDGSDAPQGALLADRFYKVAPDVWAVRGNPAPQPVWEGQSWALDMLGDGVGYDAIESVASFDLSRGATLELEFRMSLTRRDRQKVTVCLVATEGDPGKGSPSPAEVVDRLCFGYPEGELGDFQPDAVGFYTQILVGPHITPELFPYDGWAHVAIVLAPDGQGRLLVRGREVATLPLPVTVGPNLRWQVMVSGRAADTRLLIRDLVLWEGMRY